MKPIRIMIERFHHLEPCQQRSGWLQDGCVIATIGAALAGWLALGADWPARLALDQAAAGCRQLERAERQRRGWPTTLPPGLAPALVLHWVERYGVLDQETGWRWRLASWEGPVPRHRWERAIDHGQALLVLYGYEPAQRWREPVGPAQQAPRARPTGQARQVGQVEQARRMIMHSVLVYGYDHESYYCLNSFGHAWGTGGHGRLLRSAETLVPFAWALGPGARPVERAGRVGRVGHASSEEPARDHSGAG